MEGGNNHKPTTLEGVSRHNIKGEKRKKEKKTPTFRKSYELYYCAFCTVLRDDSWDVKKNVTVVQ